MRNFIYLFSFGKPTGVTNQIIKTDTKPESQLQVFIWKKMPTQTINSTILTIEKLII